LSDFVQQELTDIAVPAASAKPTTNAEAFNEVEKIINANMRATPFTAANISYSIDGS